MIELDGVVLAVLLATDLGEAKERGCGEGALLGVAGEDLLVVFRGGFGIAGDFLGVEAVAQEIAKWWFFSAGDGGGQEQTRGGEAEWVEVHGRE